jgi:hypothetical protein
MVEPSENNSTRQVAVYGGAHGNWRWRYTWQKDSWPMGLFQYGNAFLPDGKNTTNLLAVTTVAVDRGDLETTIWRI